MSLTIDCLLYTSGLWWEQFILLASHAIQMVGGNGLGNLLRASDAIHCVLDIIINNDKMLSTYKLNKKFSCPFNISHPPM
jgi:hypothetical protein